MRLLLTTDTVGGVWTFTLHLAHGLLALGCDLALVSFGWHPSPSQQAQADHLLSLFPGRCTFHSCDAALEWMPENRTAYHDGEALLLDLCHRFQPEALLCSQFCWGALPVAIPKLIVAHSDVLSWADAVGKAPLPADDWLNAYRTQVQAGLNGVDYVTAPTAAMLQDLLRNFHVEAPASVIPNGIARTPQVSGPRTLQAVTAGRMWDEAKGLDMLRHVVSPMPIAVAGEQRTDQQPLPTASRVSLLGPVPHAELLRLFSRSALYLCTSVYEPFGLAALEAAQCGCAVLANDIPSLREVWGDAALYFSNAADLSHLLTTLAADEALLAETQKCAGQHAAHYTAERMAALYLQLIQGLTTASSQHRVAAEGEPARAA